MKLKICLLLLVVSTFLYAQPRFFVEDKQHDWGTVIEGDKMLKHTFVVVNKGNDTLKISRVNASCGCTVAKYDTVVAPGKTGKISAEFNINGKAGRETKTLTVSSNDADSAQIHLNLTVFIKTPLDISQKWMSLYSNKGKVSGAISFLTPQSNFAVNKAQYVSNNQDSQKPAPTPITVNMKFKTKSAPDANGNITYEYEFGFSKNVEAYENGAISFETNVKEKPSISANVSIEPQKDAPY